MGDDDLIRRGDALQLVEDYETIHDRISLLPAADARGEALKEALQALRGAGSFGRTAAEKHAALEQYCLCRDAILALIPETKPQATDGGKDEA